MEEGCWPLVKTDPNLTYVFRPFHSKQIDWDRYVDEDEEEENPSFDMSQLQGGMVGRVGDGRGLRARVD